MQLDGIGKFIAGKIDDIIEMEAQQPANPQWNSTSKGAYDTQSSQINNAPIVDGTSFNLSDILIPCRQCSSLS